MKRFHFAAGILFFALVMFGCSKNPSEPQNEQTQELSDAEQMMIISTELANEDGGAMADMEMLAESASGNFALGKVAGFDTTVTRAWIQYSLSLAFYNNRGIEQQHYVNGVTDSLTYTGQLTGTYENRTKTLSIVLNSSSSLNASGLISKTIKVNGVWNNNSQYGLQGVLRKINVKSTTSIKVENVVIDLNTGTYFPSSGKLVGTIEGVFTGEGPENSVEQAYSFPFEITFNGGKEVTVTLPSGKQYTLDLATGQFS